MPESRANPSPENSSGENCSLTRRPTSSVRGIPEWASGPCAARFQASLYAYYRGDYSVALSEFEKLADRFRRNGDTSRYVECSVYVLRLLAEREEFKKIAQIENEILALLENPKIKIEPQLRSRAQYVLGICLVYQGSTHDKAMNKFHDSIRSAVECSDRSALAWPLYGAATVLYARERYADAQKELDKLRTLLSCWSVPELEASSHLLQSLISRNSGDLESALRSAWAAFESLRTQPQLGLYLHTLATLATVYAAKKEPHTARLYLELADRTLRRDELPRIARIVDDALKALGPAINSEFDLKFDEECGTLTEARKGEVRFDGQFVLRDLLQLFLKSSLREPGRAIKKEEIVLKVWGETYRPDLHDNKIYVNIKRLRRLIESADGTSEYIMRGKHGYYLNPKTRVVLVEKGAQ